MNFSIDLFGISLQIREDEEGGREGVSDSGDYGLCELTGICFPRGPEAS